MCVKMITSFLIVLSFVFVESQWPFTCSDDIYCHGNLLHTVQMSRIYNDSKTFVDMKMKYDRKRTLEMFDDLMLRTGGHPNRSQVVEFVDKHFEPPGSEFEAWTPTDWTKNPKFLNEIENEEAKQWCKHLNGLWKFLGRKIKVDVKLNPQMYSIIYVPNPIIIPGGRFREFYYWDSYWIVKGLLHSEMYSTVKGMLSNFISMVDRFGFVPNGGRVYYTMRSQPPLLIPMVKTYLDATQDYSFLADNIDSLEKEFQFWMRNRTVTIEKGSKQYILARYAEASTGPRPESYWEDVNNAQSFPTEELKTEFYSQIKSAAESGWDFSSRWFVSEGGYSNEISDIKTKNIVPVDLNSILYMNAELLSEFYEKLDLHKKALTYARIANKWRIAVNQVLWHEDVGSWLDYDLENGVRRNYFYASNLFPLWTKCYDESRSDLVHKVIGYLEKNEISKYPGGIPTSLFNTGQQWDFPNAWPPSQYSIIEGLNSTEEPCAMRWARNLARKWIRSNFEAYKLTGSMYEKYDAALFGGHGSGGEYQVQLGFGWTNGVIMDLLSRFPDALTSKEPESYCSISKSGGGNLKGSEAIKLFSIILILLYTLIQ